MDAAWRGVEGSSTQQPRLYTCRRSIHVARTAAKTAARRNNTCDDLRKFLLMASRRTWLLFSNTHKKRTIRVPRKMMPTLVTNKFMYNEAGARCIVPSLSRGLTLTAQASTSHEPVLPSAMLPHPCHFTPSSTAMHPAQDCFALRHAAAACHSAASPEPRVITTHKPRKKASAPCKIEFKSQATEQVQLL